jgi:hypothetical protein
MFVCFPFLKQIREAPAEHIHDIYYEYYATGDHPNFVLQFPTIGKKNMADVQTCEVGATLVPLNYGSEMM